MAIAGDWHGLYGATQLIAKAALASPSTQESAPAADAEEDFENREPNERVSIPRGEILARDKALTAKDRLIRELEDQLAHANGVIMGQAVVLNEADGKLAALRTYAGESAAQSERAGLERAAKWHEAEARKTMIAHKILFHQNSAATLRKLEPPANLTSLSAARKAGGE